MLSDPATPRPRDPATSLSPVQGFVPWAALLLDLDGTLVESEPKHAAAHIRFLATQGIALTEADCFSNIGKGDRSFYAEVMKTHGRHDDPVAWVAAKTRTLISLYHDEGLALRPGVESLLARAAAAGTPCLVVTSAERALAQAALHVTRLAQRLPMVIAHEDVDKHKPDPFPYLLAASRLGVPIQRCLVIEDSPTGVRAGVASGATCVGVPGLVPAAALRAAGAHHLVARIDAAWDVAPQGHG